jgi:hypothetical protein
MVPYEASAALAAGIPNAQFATFPPGEHHTFDIVDVVIDKVLNFCERPSGTKVRGFWPHCCSPTS